MLPLINVGVDLDQFDQFRYLPKKFRANNGKQDIAIHHIGSEQLLTRLYNSSFEVTTDSIDVYLHPASRATNGIVPLMNHRPMQLWEKPTQLSFLHRLKQLSSDPLLARFKVQEYVCVIPNSPRQQSKRQFSQMQLLGNRFIIRPNTGANGLGVKMISGDLIPKTADELNSVDWIERIASNQQELDKYAASGFHFCEMIDDAVEIRILRSASGTLMSANRSRKVTDTSNGAALARVGSDYSFVLRDSLDDTPVSCEQVNALIKAIEPLHSYGSYDLWIRPDGTFGLFEVSTQFALNCCNPTSRIDFMKDYIESLIGTDYIK